MSTLEWEYSRTAHRHYAGPWSDDAKDGTVCRKWEIIDQRERFGYHKPKDGYRLTRFGGHVQFSKVVKELKSLAQELEDNEATQKPGMKPAMTTPHPPAETPSDTPETDAAKKVLIVEGRGVWEYVEFDFARTLERQNAQLRADLAAAREERDEAVAVSYSEGANDVRSELIEVWDNPDAGHDEIDGMKPICRIEFLSETGDESDGYSGWSGWCLAKDQGGTELDRILTDNAALAARADAAESAISDLMPFVLDDYMPDFAVPHFKVAVETAQAIAERFDAARERIGG